MIESIEDIQHLLREGFDDWKSLGDVAVTHHNGMTLFNYTNAAQYAGRWNFFERVSRGLILDEETGEVIARPFDKFFNWGEGGRMSQARIVSVTEKVDGSLGILYRRNGLYYVATRGSFDGPQAQWATTYLRDYFPHLKVPDNWTVMFEIVYHDNRIVVDYGGYEGLTFLAIRDRFTGEYVPTDIARNWMIQWAGMNLCMAYPFDDAAAVLSLLPTLDANHEGYVVEFADGERFKFKGQRYLELHRLISTLSFKNTLAAAASGTIDFIREQVPDEFLTEFEGWVTEIERTVREVRNRAERAFAKAPTETRKQFALWVGEFYPDIALYLFAMLDGRDITPLIYRTAFKDRESVIS